MDKRNRLSDFYNTVIESKDSRFKLTNNVSFWAVFSFNTTKLKTYFDVIHGGPISELGYLINEIDLPNLKLARGDVNLSTERSMVGHYSIPANTYREPSATNGIRVSFLSTEATSVDRMFLRWLDIVTSYNTEHGVFDNSLQDQLFPKGKLTVDVYDNETEKVTCRYEVLDIYPIFVSTVDPSYRKGANSIPTREVIFSYRDVRVIPTSHNSLNGIVHEISNTDTGVGNIGTRSNSGLPSPSSLMAAKKSSRPGPFRK
jgi:hypothetical protein